MVLAGCGGGDSKPDAAVAYEDAAVCVPGSQATSTVYLNFGGATYAPAVNGADDAITNKANPIDMNRTLAPWPHANQAEIKSCVEAALKPFRVAVTDVDPGSTMHHEVVLTDLFWVAGDPTVQTTSSSNCGGTILNTVTFLFANGSGSAAQTNCNDLLLQLAVATTGLDHVLDCNDYLSNGSCGPKSWTTTPAPCGDDSPRACTCGGSHQISMKKMTDVFGASCAL